MCGILERTRRVCVRGVGGGVRVNLDLCEGIQPEHRPGPHFGCEAFISRAYLEPSVEEQAAKRGGDAAHVDKAAVDNLTSEVRVQSRDQHRKLGLLNSHSFLCFFFFLKRCVCVEWACDKL